MKSVDCMRSFVPFGLFVVMLNLFCPWQVAAQPGANLSALKQQLKSLQQRHGSPIDTTYINTINQVAFLYADRYPDSAFELLKDIPSKSASMGYYHGEIDSYKILGNASQTKGDFDKALEYYEHAYQIADKHRDKKRLPALLGNVALVYLNKGNYPVSLQKFYASLKAAESAGDKLVIRSSLNNIGTIHFYQGKMDEAETAYEKTLELSTALSDTTGVILAYNNLGEVSLEQGKPTKALAHLNKAYDLARAKNIPDMLVAVTNTLGDTYLRLDSTLQAATYFDTALRLGKEQGNARAICKALIGLAKVHNKEGRLQQGLAKAHEALDKAKEMGQAQLLRDAYEVVAALYEKTGDGNNAIKYFRNYKIYADSLVSIENERAAANYKAGYEFSKKEQEFEQKSLQQRWLIFSVSAALVSLLIILSLIIRNRKRLSKTNQDLHHKNKIIEQQKKHAEETLDKLKLTQSQLIQAEKMASLGELTAGIAHEIQNPLNFVNNFSEVNNELIADMHVEIDKGDFVEAKAIANDIRQNMEKINHHGRRADAIVKGMLQHSRSSSGVQEPTNINHLADEYLRLAYHGLRAKDKSFNATLITDYDESLSQVNVVRQDLGRVILNLVTNAFYAVEEKKKTAEAGYAPTVTVSTKLINTFPGGSRVLIKVADNGNGVPQKILDKIFQPFFTTKPPGQGTGLGLSLSYDIVKAHGGELKVETNEGQGTKFIIELNSQLTN